MVVLVVLVVLQASCCIRCSANSSCHDQNVLNLTTFWLRFWCNFLAASCSESAETANWQVQKFVAHTRSCNCVAPATHSTKANYQVNKKF